MLHTYPFLSLGEAYEISMRFFANLAVPAFFIMIGLFINEKSNLLKQGINYLKIYVVWSVIYTPIIFYRYIWKNEKGYIYGIITEMRDFIVHNSYCQLWFLLAAGETLLLLYWARRGDKWKYYVLALVSIVGVLFNIFYQKIYGAYTGKGPSTLVEYIWFNLCGSGNNVIFEGLFFILLGMTIRKSKIRKLHNYVIGIVVSFVFYFLEYVSNFFVNGSKLYLAIFMIPLLYCYCSIIFFYDSSFLSEQLSKHIRKLSTLIYLTHAIFISFWNTVERALFKLGIISSYFFQENSMLYFIVVLMSSVIASEIIMSLSKFQRLHNLKRL